MRRSDYRGAKCVKRKLSKCEDVCRTYGDLQHKFADLLETSDDIASFQVNVEMTGLNIDGKFTTDFVAVKTDGELMVRECVERNKIHTPRNCRMLDASREYWLRHGIKDWGIVVDSNKGGIS